MAYNMGTSNASQEELERLRREQEALQNANNAQQASTPTSYSGYTPGQTVQNYQQQANNLQAQKPADYTSKYQDGIDQLFDKILNRGKFEYDMNADTLYKQAMDKYAQQARMGMMDTMGQAQAMTGGYGNSYAQTAGQQTYDKTMQNVTDMLPAMEERSRSKWNDEGNQMAQNLAMSQNAEQQEYGKYRDAYGDWQYDYGTALDRYNNERSFDYGAYSDRQNTDFQREQFDYTKEQDAKAEAFQKLQWDTAQAARSSGGGGSRSANFTEDQFWGGSAALETGGLSGLRQFVMSLATTGKYSDEALNIFVENVQSTATGKNTPDYKLYNTGR